MSTNSRFYSVVFNKCPRCHQGDFFVTNSAFSRHFDEMHDHCPHCGENFMPEPGFYWASMFVSYAFYTIYTLLTFFIFVQGFQVDLDYYLIGLIPTLILLTPYFFRMARRTWLTLFIAPRPAVKNSVAGQNSSQQPLRKLDTTLPAANLDLKNRVIS